MLFCPWLFPLCDNTLTPGVFRHAAIRRHKEIYSTIISSSGPCVSHFGRAALLTFSSQCFTLMSCDVKIGQRWKVMNQPPKRCAIIIWPPFSSHVFLFLLVMKHIQLSKDHSGWHPVLQCGTIYTFDLFRTLDSHNLIRKYVLYITRIVLSLVIAKIEMDKWLIYFWGSI